MTLEQVEALPKDFLTIAELSSYMQCDPQTFRLQARKDPSKIGFPVIVIGTRVKIPKIPFVKFMRGDTTKQLKGE